MYDSLLANSLEALAIGGGTAGDSFSRVAESNNTRLRALRCTAIGASYISTGSYVKAVAIFKHAQGLATDAAEQYQAIEGDEAEASVKEMAALELKATGAKCKAEALSYLSSTTYPPSANLLDRLDTYSSGKGADGAVRVAKQGLQLKTVCPKPTFFDLAHNYVAEYPDLVGGGDGGEGESSEEEEEEEEEERGEEKAVGGGGLLGWFTGR